MQDENLEEHIEKLFEKAFSSTNKKQIFEEIKNLTKNSLIFGIYYYKKKSKSTIHYGSFEVENKSYTKFDGLFDYKNWKVLSKENSNNLKKIGERISKYFDYYPEIIHQQSAIENIGIDIEIKYLEVVNEYFRWLGNRKDLNLIQLFHLSDDLIKCNENNVDYSKNILNNYDVTKISKIIFSTDLKNNNYHGFGYDSNGNSPLPDDYHSDCFDIMKIKEIFWTQNNLEFEIVGNICTVKSEYGLFKSTLKTFISIFLTPINEEECFNLDSKSYMTWIDHNTFYEDGYGIRFVENLKAFCSELSSQKQQYGYYYGIDKFTLFHGLMEAFRFRDDHLPMMFDDYEDTSKIYKPLVELIYIGVLIQDLGHTNKSDYEFSFNPFTKRNYQNAIQVDDNAYIKWLISSYKQIKNVGFNELAEIYILLGTINTIWHDKLINDSWAELIDIISSDSFSYEKKKILYEFISMNLPKKVSQNSLYFESRFSEFKLDKNLQNFNKFKYEKLTKDFTENMILDKYSQDQIQQHFIYYQFSIDLKNYRDNIVLPLFKAVEKEVSDYLISQNIISEKRNTNFHDMLIKLREHIKDINLNETLAKKWNKVKREAFRLAPIRNMSAHASLMDANDVQRSQKGVKELLEWFTEFKIYADKNL